MKARLITLLFMGFIAVNAASAAQELNHADGKDADDTSGNRPWTGKYLLYLR